VLEKEAERVAAVNRGTTAEGERNLKEQQRLGAVDDLTAAVARATAAEGVLEAENVNMLKDRLARFKEDHQDRLQDFKEQADRERQVGRPAVITPVVQECNQEILNLAEKAVMYREFIRNQNIFIPPHLHFQLQRDNVQQQQGPPPQQQQQQQPPEQH
jgi:hypothetical protein